MGIEIEFDEEDSGVDKEIEFDSPVKQSLSYGLTKQPDQHSRIVSLADKERLPVDMVERNLPDLQARENRANLKVDKIEFDTPVTARALADPDTAAMSHDDLDNLSAIERIYRKQEEKSFGNRLLTGVRKANLGMIQTGRAIEYKIAKGRPETLPPHAIAGQKLMRSVFSSLGLPDLIDPVEEVRQKMLGEKVRAVTTAEAGLREIAAITKALPEDPKVAQFSDLVEKTKEEKGTVAATAAGVAFLAKNPDMFAVLLAEQASPLAIAGGGTGALIGKAVSAPLAKKITSEAMKKYVSTSVTMAGVQLTSNASLMYGQEITAGLNQGLTVDESFSRAGKKTLAESMTNAGFAFIPAVGGRYAQVVQEPFKQGVAGATGAAVGAAVVGEDITLTELLLEGFGEFAGAPIDIVMAGAASRRDRIDADHLSNLKEQTLLLTSNIDQMRLDELVNVAKANKLGDRNSERFGKFMQSVVNEYGEDAQVYIDGDKVSDIIADMDADLPGVQEMQRQLAQGGDIAIPLESYIADISRSSAGEQIRPHVRLDVDGLSQVELEEAVPQMEQRVKEILEKADLAATESIRIDEITDQIFTQLMETGRVSTQIAKMSSQIIPAYVATKASEYGLTVDAMYEKLGFGGVRGPEGAVVVEPGDQLEQVEQRSADAGYPLAPRGEWYGDADFKARGGRVVMMSPSQYIESVAPLTLDEESRDNIDDLKEHIGSGRALDPLAIYEGGKEDGRHRAYAAQESGITEVPVLLFGDQVERFAEKAEFQDVEGLLSQEQIDLDPDLTALAEFQAMSGGDQFRQYEVREEITDRLIKRHLEDESFQGMHLPAAVGTVLIAPSAKEPGMWQVTQYNNKFEPMSDNGTQTKADALAGFFDEARPERTGEVLAQSQVEDKNLVVTHNLSAENILAAADLGGLAAPSIATIRADISDFEQFGEVSLLADPSLLESAKARTFDADVYTPRQPRATFQIDLNLFNELNELLDPEGWGLSKPDIHSLEDGSGAENLQRSAAVQYLWLQEQGKALKAKMRKVASAIKKAAEIEGPVDHLNPEIKKLATRHYKALLKKVAAADEGRVERYSGMWFEDNGDISPRSIIDFTNEVRSFKSSGGVDTHQLRSDIDKKMRVKKTRDAYDQWVTDKFNDMVTGQKLFKGFTSSGNRKYVDYNMQNVVKEMTQKLQAGEASFYGAGTVRSAFANEMKTIAQVKSRRDQIVSEEEMTQLKEDSSQVLEEAFDQLKPFYKFDADSWGYSEDAGNAIMEGRKGLNEAFNMTPEAQQIVDDLVNYLVALPSSYFETKIQRPVEFSEFNTAVVPRGMRKDALKVLKDAGLKIKTYDPSGKGKTRQGVVAEQERLLFQPEQEPAKKGEQPPRATFDINDRVITLLEQSDPTSFIHESGHLFLEMEKQLSAEFGVTDRQQTLLDWLGIESFDQVEVAHHEQFARGFEAYTFEGKAPSRDLAAVFASFRRWMLEIYKRITRLNVTLTPEVRDFFDHMLATDAQIEEVRDNPAYEQFFRDAKSAGMTDEEWTAYQERQEASKNKATSTLEEKILKQLKRTYTKEWKAEEADMKDQVRTELMEQDVYRAVAFLRGELKIDDIEGHKLDRAKVDEILGLVPDKKVKTKGVDNQSDSLLIAIAKLGGLDRSHAEAEGIDPENWKGRNAKSINTPVFGKPIFKINGLSFDAMLVRLGEEGYNFDQIRDLLDSIDSELRGTPIYSEEVDYGFVLGMTEEDPVKKTPLPRVLWGASNKTGLDPDEVALELGYSSGHEMLTDIVSSPEMHNVVGGIVNQRMIAKHGDILNDGTIEQEARDASQNEDKAKALMVELRALNKQAGVAQDFDRESLKAGAERTIAAAKISDIRPGRFYRAEIKAAQKAAAALESGNIDEARGHKIQQLANHYLYRESLAAEKRVVSMRRYIAGVKTRKLNPKQVDSEYIHQMKILAAAYDFRTGKRSEDEAKSALLNLAGWIESQMGSDNWIVPQFMDPTLSEMVAIKNNDALEPHEKSALIEQMTIPRYDEMTMEQLRGAYDMIKNLRYVGGRLSKGEAEAFKQLTEDTADSIIEHGGKNIPRPQEQSTAYKVISAIKQFGAEHVVLGNTIAQMDGYQKFGPMFSAFYQQILDSTNAELKLKRDIHGQLEEIFGKFKRKDLAKGFRESGHAGHRQITKTNGERWSLSRRGRLILAMYWGSPESRTALMMGNDVSETDALAMISTLTKKELDFVQNIWDLNEGLWPQVRDTALKMTGVAPPKVEHVSYEVNGRKMPGGYIRLFYDYDARDSYLADAGENGSLTRSGGHVMKNTRHGSRNERVGSGGRPVSFELDNLFRALDENIHDIAFAETARDGTRFLQSKAIRNAVVLKYGKEVFESLNASMEGIIAGNFASNHPVNSLLRYLRTNASYAMLGYSIRNVMQQPVAMTNVFGKIGEKYTLKGMAEFVFNPMKAKARVEWIQERSEFMRERTSLVNRETAEISNKIEGGLLAGPLKRHAFDLQTMGDAMVAYPAWYGAYLKELDRSGNEKQAITFADESTAQAVGSGLMKDLSPMMQGSGQLKVIGPEMLKSITFMGSYFNKVANLTRDAYKENDLSTVRGGAEFTRQMSWYLMIPAVLSALIVDDLPDEGDDEGWIAWAASKMRDYSLAQVFILRDLVYLWNGFTPSTPYTRAVTEAGRTVKLTGDIVTGEKELNAEVLAKLTRNVSAFVPLPGAGQAARTIEGAVDASEKNNRNLYQMLVEGKER